MIRDFDTDFDCLPDIKAAAEASKQTICLLISNKNGFLEVAIEWQSAAMQGPMKIHAFPQHWIQNNVETFKFSALIIVFYSGIEYKKDFLLVLF